MKIKEQLCENYIKTQIYDNASELVKAYAHRDYLAGFDEAKNLIYQEILEYLSEPKNFRITSKAGLELKKLVRECGEGTVEE